MGEKLRLYRYQTNGAKIPNKLPDNRSGDFLGLGPLEKVLKTIFM